MLGARLGRGRQGAGVTGRLEEIERPSGKIVQGVAAGIGLVAEAYHHHKEKKALKTKTGDTLPEEGPGGSGDRQAGISQEREEANWQLDEAQDQIVEEDDRYAIATEEQLSQLANDFLQTHPILPDLQPAPQGLALPVLLTQRRPGKRSRGFIRAYAPLLSDVGIDQSTFLNFVDDLNKAVQPSGLIQALNLASLAGMAVPEPFTIIISVAIQLATNMGDEVHSRMKTNKFLDRINDKFFKPKGLIALVMTWKPSRADELLTIADFDMQASVAAAASADQGSSPIKRFQHKFDQSSGTTSFEFPETAPLVFPMLDNLAIDHTNGGEKLRKQQSAVKRSGNFVREYMDKRARAEWAGKNPDSRLANAGPKEEFHSRYSDPNHAASSGDPLALLTGGHVQRGAVLGGALGAIGLQPGGVGGSSGRGGGDFSSGLRSRLHGSARQDEQSRQGRRELHDINDGRIGGSTRNGRLPIGNVLAGTGLGGLSLISGAKKLLQQDILYLMVIQRPTADQLAEAADLLASRQ